jgi:hypothetical protein
MKYVSLRIAVLTLGLASEVYAGASLEQTLSGKWLVFWTAEGRVSSVSIENVRFQGNITTFDGSILQGDEHCPITGHVISSLQLDYTDGLERTSIRIPTIVRLSAACSNMTIAMEVFGMSDGKFLMSGRAIIKIAGGAQVIQPIGMSPIQ